MSTDLAERDADNGQLEAISRLPADMAIMKMENESIMSMAATRPRDFSRIKSEIQEQLNEFPEQAADLIYNKPVGRENDTCSECGCENYRGKGQKTPNARCFRCKKDTVVEGQMKFARGLSIRAAEMLSESYGFNRVRGGCVDLDADKVQVEATFVDYQKGRVWTDSTIMSKYYRGRDGSMRRHDDDRFYNVLVKAEKSKVIREVIVRSVNSNLKKWLEDQAEKLIDQLLDDSTIDKIIGQFSGLGVTQADIERLLGKTRKQGWTKAERKTLAGVWTAIKDKETSVSEAFGIGDEPGAPTNGKVRTSPLNEKLSDKPKGKRKPEPEAEPGEESQDIPAELQKFADSIASGQSEYPLDEINAALSAGDITPEQANWLRDMIPA